MGRVSLEPVRNAAGHALCAIGTPEARRALLDLIDDSDHLSVYLAVAAVFDEDPATAFDRLLCYFEPARFALLGGAEIPNVVLATFAPKSFVVGRDGELTPQWADSRAPIWLRQDPRWIKLCVALRHDKHLGRSAREVLRHAGRGPCRPLRWRRLGPAKVHASSIPQPRRPEIS